MGRQWSHVLAASIAAVQGVALVGNALAVIVVVLRDGITGPAAVASPIGVTVEVAIYLIFGAAMCWIAWGLAAQRTAARTPFLLAQILSLTVGIPLLGASGAGFVAGVLITAAAVAGIVAWGGLLRDDPRRQSAAARTAADHQPVQADSR